MRIIRFEDSNGHIHYGHNYQQSSANLLEGDLFNFKPATQTLEVKRLLAPIEPRNIFCIGLNYREHAHETGMQLPKHPIIFMKNTASIQHPGASIVIPSVCQQPAEVDFEGELAIVIGKAAKNVSPENASDYVFGYTIGNDVSARRWQKNAGSGQWVKGKSFDTFCPLGPELITADEIENPQALSIQTHVNGQLMQNGNTDDMIFSIAEIIAYLSQSATLLPGSIILTGTPAGVGYTQDPPVFLQAGDKVEVSIGNLGTLSNPVINE